MEIASDPARQRIFHILDQYGISPDYLCQLAGCSRRTLDLALGSDTFENIPLIFVLRIRANIEIELANNGWTGNANELWKDFVVKPMAARNSCIDAG